MGRKLHFIIILFLCVSLVQGKVTTFVNRVPEKDIIYLKNLAKDTWHCIDYFVHPVTGIPFDSNAKGDGTNTTNIGLYIASIVAAFEMGFISRSEAILKIKKILLRLKKYEHWKGFLNNWLSVGGSTQAKPGINAVTDFNKLPAGLVTASQTFPEIARECLKFVNRIDWSILYDKKDKKDYWGYDVVNQKRDGYGLWLAADSRLASFFKIASEKIPSEIWPALGRKKIKQYGYKFYEPGWNFGGLFMQAMGGLFMDERTLPMGESTANFAYVQMIYAEKKGYPVWGWSNCILLDGTYTEGGFLNKEVITPHASALALIYYPGKVIANLRMLEKMGVREPLEIDGQKRKFGFRDSIDLSTGKVSETYFTGLDQAMLFISIVNFLKDGVIWKHFAQNPVVARGLKIMKKFEKENSSLLKVYEERDKKPISVQKELIPTIKKRVIDSFNRTLSKNNIKGKVHIPSKYGRKGYRLKLIKEEKRGRVLSLKYNLNKTKNGTIMVCEELPGIDLRSFNAVTFDVRGDEKEGFTRNFRVQFFDRNDVYSVSYVTGIKDKWKRVVLPLKDFYGILSDEEHIKSINFVLDKGQWYHLRNRVTKQKGKLYIDNLTFETLPQEELEKLNQKNIISTEKREIDDFEYGEDWNIVKSENSSGHIDTTIGWKGKGLKLKYKNSDKNGWVMVEKNFNIDIGKDFEFSFYLKKEGKKPINLEFKLIDKDGSVFVKKFIGLEDQKTWKKFFVKLDDLQYWWGGDNLLNDLNIISFAVSGGEGDGTIYLDSLKVRKIEKKFGLKIKRAWASSVLGDNTALLVFDDNTQTRWESHHGADPVWLACELKNKTQISKITIFWETASASVYDIQISEDGKTWQTIKSINDGTAGEIMEIEFNPVKTKYIRIYGKQRATQWGYSIWDVKIYEK